MPRTNPKNPAYSVWRRKPVGDLNEEAESSGLFKSLGLWQLTAIGVGGIVGVGIFSLAGLVAHGDATNPGVGPAVVISFLIAGLASAAAALSYAEFAGMIPRAGSAYSYGYVALGEITGWFIGWDLLLEYVAIVAVVAIGISGYLDAFLSGFGVHLPAAVTETFDQPGGVVNIPAILICLLVTFLLSRGTKTFGRFELVAVGIKILLILFIVGLGIFYINTDNYTPFMPSGFGPVFTGAATVFFAVFGYDAMSTAAEEAKDGRKHMPKAIILSLIIAMLLYVAATLVLTGMQNYQEIDPKAGFASAFSSVGLPVIASIISVFAVLSILTVMLTFLLGATRVWFSMSRDGLAPRLVLEGRRPRRAPAGDLDRGHRLRVLRRDLPHPCRGRPDEHRHPGGVRRRLHRRRRVPVHQAGRPAHLPAAVHAGGADRRRRLLAVPHLSAALGDLAALRRLARDRTRRLLRLRPPPLADEPRQPPPPALTPCPRPPAPAARYEGELPL